MVVSQLYCCAYASDCTETKGLLTALSVPEESLSRPKAVALSCALALASCLLLHWGKWIRQKTAGKFCHTPRVPDTIIVYIFCKPHSWQVEALLAALFCCQSTAALTDTSHVLKCLCAWTRLHTDKCAGCLAVVSCTATPALCSCARTCSYTCRCH